MALTMISLIFEKQWNGLDVSIKSNSNPTEYGRQVRTARHDCTTISRSQCGYPRPCFSTHARVLSTSLFLRTCSCRLPFLSGHRQKSGKLEGEYTPRWHLVYAPPKLLSLTLWLSPHHFASALALACWNGFCLSYPLCALLKRAGH